MPTFPNATYLIPRVDKVYFDPRNAHRRPTPRNQQDRIDANLSPAPARRRSDGSRLAVSRWAP